MQLLESIGRLTQAKRRDPREIFGLRMVVRFARDPLGLLTELRQEHGDFVELDVFGTPWFLLSHPDDIETVLVEHARIMGRDDYVETLERTLGKGLLTSEGPLWKRQRKLMAQAFTPRRIREYAETMVEVAERDLSWVDGQELNIHQEMSRLTMEIVAAVLFGTGIGPREVEIVGTSMEAINEFYAASPEALLKLPGWVPTPLNRRVARAVTQLDGLIYEIIAERRRGEPRSDLLGTLLAAVDDSGEGMDDQQLRDEAMTLFLAGHETTALTLAYSLYLLGKYPEVERRLLAELDEVLDGAQPTVADIGRLTYTKQVLEESMRLFPPAWATGREALEELELRGVRIAKGSQLIMSEWVVHRDPRWFPDPEAFDPDRWTPERRRALPRYAYFPFGGGPRVCIGNHFAMMEATLLLAMIVARGHLEIIPGQRLELEPSVTLRPKGAGLRAVFHARR